MFARFMSWPWPLRLSAYFFAAAVILAFGTWAWDIWHAHREARRSSAPGDPLEQVLSDAPAEPERTAHSARPRPQRSTAEHPAPRKLPGQDRLTRPTQAEQIERPEAWTDETATAQLNLRAPDGGPDLADSPEPDRQTRQMRAIHPPVPPRPGQPSQPTQPPAPPLPPSAVPRETRAERRRRLEAEEAERDR